MPGKPEPKQSRKQQAVKAVQPSADPVKKIQLPMAAVLAITFLAYLPALSNGLLLWDDHVYLWQNPWLREFDWAKVFSTSTFHLGHYHPLTMLWLHWEYLLFPAGDPSLYGGLSPFWFHLGSLALHLANTALVFYTVWLLFDRKEWAGAAFAAVLFGIHPMHVESVAWVAELKDVLYSAFFLSAILLYMRYLRTGKILWIMAVFLAFLLSCLSKGQAITLPAVLLLLDFFRNRKWSWRIIWEKLPFFVLSVFFGILAVKASESMSVMNTSQTSLLMNVLNACYSFLWYIVKAAVPTGLCAVHPYTYGGTGDIPFWFYLLPLIVLALFVAVFFSLKHTKQYFFGFLFYALTVSIMLKLVPVGDSLVNERYSYIPYIGLFFIAAHLFTNYGLKGSLRYPAWGVVAILVFVYGLMTAERIRIWKDNASFWTDVTEKYPDFWRGYYGLAVLHYGEGNTGKAFELANQACDRNPPAAPYALRGTIYFDKLKKEDLAIADYTRVLGFNEKDSPFNLMAWTNLGISWFNRGETVKADSAFSKALELNPGEASLYWFKAMSSAALGDFAGAVAKGEKAKQMGFSVEQERLDLWKSKLR